MAIIKRDGRKDVVEMAENRVKNVFNNGVPVYMGFSGGKDSLAIAQLVYSLMERGEIDPSLLTVNFIDEEAIYPCIERTVKEWRKKFLMMGAQFYWYCLEVKHFNALNSLSADESFICWDRYKKDVWVRSMPKFADTYHPLLKTRQETYQDFLIRIESDGITMTGVRTSESIQRLDNFSKRKSNDIIMPIYDWKDADVWLYLYEQGVKVPEIYLYLYQVGKTRQQLRVSQFFSSDTVGSLVSMNEFYPDLMERIIKREPNAYLVALYYDTEMFRRSTRKRRKLEANNDDQINYEEKVIDLLSNIKANFETPHKRNIARKYRGLFMKTNGIATEKNYKRMYEALLGGDPKQRSYRALFREIYSDAIQKEMKR